VRFWSWPGCLGQAGFAGEGCGGGYQEVFFVAGGPPEGEAEGHGEVVVLGGTLAVLPEQGGLANRSSANGRRRGMSNVCASTAARMAVNRSRFGTV
jgi:hypothetical protein